MKNYLKTLGSLLCMLCISCVVYGQKTITGTIMDGSLNEPLIGANIIVSNSSIGTITDFDGSFSLEVPADATTLEISFTGYETQTFPIADINGPLNVTLQEGQVLDEVVVVGYATVKEEDATGSVDLITTKDMNKGAIQSADQLLNGKATGVRIVNSGGDPDAEANIRIRGGSSLSASNSPLIVVDGIPLSNNNPAGQRNVFQLVNPNDIQSFSILKDASATAIYGSRASNGVIIITTKKGQSGAPQFSYNNSFQLGTLTRRLDVLGSEEYVQFINQNYPDEANLLGVNGTVYDTDWQDQIYRNSFSQDHNFSVAGTLGDMRSRMSLGYSSIKGILRTSNLDRYSAAVNLAPTLFDGALDVDINLKGVLTRKNSADGGAIGDALALNPTIPVQVPEGGDFYGNRGNDFFGGYYQTVDPTNLENGDVITTNHPTNALARLEQRMRDENADRFLGNVKFAYNLPFAEGLQAILNVGMDKSSSNIEELFTDNAIAAYNNNFDNPAFNSMNPLPFSEIQDKEDRTLDAYLAYNRDYDGTIRNIDAQAGYAYQNFEIDGTRFETRIDDASGERISQDDFRYVNKQNLQSFFGRMNVDFLGKFLVTASYRADASSLFPSDKRWGHFPSAAVAWKLHKEDFMANSSAIDEFKLRAGWGVTGQQDITGVAGYYPYSALYINGQPVVSYGFGNQFYTTYRAEPFNTNLTWERTTTWNAGLDYSFANGLLSGSFDAYLRDTEDLLAEVPDSEGGLRNRLIKNVGSTESKGFEVALNLNAITRDNFSWALFGNLSYNRTEITDLSTVSQLTIGGTGTGRGTGTNIGVYRVGLVGRNFWLYEQIYDSNGQPINSGLVDHNGDGQLTDDDRQFYNFDPQWTYGFGTNLTFGKLDVTANFRGQIGGLIFNANLLNRGFSDGAIPVQGNGFLLNVLDLYENGEWTGFEQNPSEQQGLSDYYISDATFLRMDNLAFSYNLGNVISDNSNLRLNFSINNVFVITDYEGLDPENFSGIEQNPYARPRIYSFGLNLDF